ncbi:unnamed protein product [Enterobius vermicularis]|uniref:Guanine nucleotide-binding protein-like 3 homolog n=1 Tax=Enterobius vermicularis TaxID=51028 RepID=A0A0N4VFB8_ENTVE|nr:unnamed protein product [Enterobius vermicularis]
MAKYCLKKPSKRMTCAKRYKIEKKVREHNRKIKKLEKQKGKKHKGLKPVSVPNKCPFKEELLMEAEKAREQIENAKKEKKLNPYFFFLSFVSHFFTLQGASYERLAAAGTSEIAKNELTKEKNVRTYAGEVWKTVEAADVIIEESVLNAGKRMVLLLNKIDLVPKENVQKWLTYLRGRLPTIAFKASTQEQAKNLFYSLIFILICIGADLLLKLLNNYCRNKDIKTSIRVGIVGFPNVGKSSVINSMKRKRACNVGAEPGVTKQVQEVELDKHIRLLDSPGVVLALPQDMDSVELALKNAVRPETLSDPVAPVQAILRRCSRDLTLYYKIPKFGTCEEFLSSLARRFGKLKKGARPDTVAAAKRVLHDWNAGNLRYYTEPPQLCAAEILTEYSKEFDLDALDEDQKIVVEGNLVVPYLLDATVYFVIKNATEMDEFKFPASLKIDGNVQINRAIKKAIKRHKKKERKTGNADFLTLNG